MGQFPVPAFRVYGLLLACAGLALISTSSPGLIASAQADETISQDSTGSKVDLDVLNGNLLSVVQVLRMKSQAQIIVVGGDKAYNSVSLMVTGPLPNVLKDVADSAGATLSRNSDGVYILRPLGSAPTDDSIDTDQPKVVTAVDTTPVAPAAVIGPQHIERIRLQYINPKYVLTMLRDKEDADVQTLMASSQDSGMSQGSNVSVVIPQTPFTLNRENTGDQNQQVEVQPSVPNGQGMQGGNAALQANNYVTNNQSQSQQFLAPSQFGGGQGGGFGDQTGGGFGGAGGGGIGGRGGAGAAQASLRPTGVTSIIADQQDNSLLVEGDAEGIQELRQIIQLLDIPAKQVQIKAEFITASVSTVDQFGINFQLVPAPNISTAFTGSTVTGSTVVEFSQGNLVAELQAQLSTDASKVVSAPLITTTNNTSATIQFNEQIPYNTSTTNVSGSGTATTSTGVGFLVVSSGLTVTPQVNGDNSVTMDLTLPNTTTNPSADTALPPTTTTQLIHTLRTVANGETMVIGGLVSKNDSNARVYVPLLGQIPIIGNLFRTRNINDASTELLIFITPTVLPYPGQFETPTPAIDTGVGVTP